VWEWGNFGAFLLNSVFYTGLTALCVVVFSCMAGFAFAKISNIKRRAAGRIIGRITAWLFGCFFIGILLPPQAIVTPLFLMARAGGLYDTRLGILIPCIGMALPVGVCLATAFTKTLPDALIESARIDGARYLRIFAVIVLPMLAPAAVSIALLTSAGVWNEFLLVKALASSERVLSLPAGIVMAADTLDYGALFAALTMAVLVTAVFFFVFRRKFIAACVIRYE
jgi:raffinose/stachyose/melibiose transport system permease protein